MPMIKTEAKKGGVLIIVENLPVPFDRRVWQQATALKDAGYGVSIICPTGKGHTERYRTNRGNQYLSPSAARGPRRRWLFHRIFVGSVLAVGVVFKILRVHGFDVIHACNPPDLIFLVALVHRVLFNKRFLFDHHDLNPELYELKFNSRRIHSLAFIKVRALDVPVS